MIDYTFDDEASAAYLRLRDCVIQRTVEISDQVNLDLDSTGTVVGVELLGISTDRRFTVSSHEIASMRRFGVPSEAMSLIESGLATKP